MSPEQAASDRVIDGRSDLYSLGAVLYEMLAGEPPHSGTTAQAIIAKLMTQEPQPLRALRASVPRNVSDAVGKALAKSPADRFGSVAEFAAALTNAAFMVRTDHDDRMLPDGRRGSGRAVGITTAAAALVGALVGIAGWSMLHGGSRKPEAVTRVQLAQRAGEEIVTPPQAPAIAISLTDRRSFNCRVFSLDENGTSAKVIREGSGRLDGVEVLGNGGIVFTSWADSSIHLFRGDRDQTLIRRGRTARHASAIASPSSSAAT